MVILSSKAASRQEKSCDICGTLFIPRNTRQHRCLPCVHKPCERCGGKKDPRGPYCKMCDSIVRTGKACPWNHKEPLTIEQVIAKVEAFGLLPEKQFAFGYVIGVMFGDGCISKVTDRVKRTRKNGTVAIFPQVSYRPSLGVTSKAFVERFISQWAVLTGRNLKSWSYLRNFDASTLKGMPDEYSKEIFVITPRHRILGQYLAYLKYESDSAELLRFPLEVIRGFIHGMIDSEGYVKKLNFVDIANKDIKLLDTLVKMFAMLDLKATIYTYPSQNVSHLVTRMGYTKFVGD